MTVAHSSWPRSSSQGTPARRYLRLGVVLAGGAAIVAIVGTSLSSNLYYQGAGSPVPWRYPLEMVVRVCLATAAETAVGYCALRFAPPGRLWVACLAGLALLVPWLVSLSGFFLHLPVFYLLHTVWVFVLVVFLSVCALASGGAGLVHWLRRRRDA